MESDTDDAGVVQFEELKVGDELVIEGERFTIQQLVENTASLFPKSENGGGLLVYHEDSDLWVFRRNKGVDQDQFRVIQ